MSERVRVNELVTAREQGTESERVSELSETVSE